MAHNPTVSGAIASKLKMHAAFLLLSFISFKLLNQWIDISSSGSWTTVSLVLLTLGNNILYVPTKETFLIKR
jgi:hypothetical protein